MRGRQEMFIVACMFEAQFPGGDNIVAGGAKHVG